MSKTLLSFGHGYSARALSRLLIPQGWTVYGTTRNPDKIKALEDEGVRPLLWEGGDFEAAFAQATHILSSVSPTQDGDPVVHRFGADLARIVPQLDWVGYLSTTGVYGDHGGGWVDETTPLIPTTRRGQQRMQAEQEWSAIESLPLHIFRLAGIYGPGRGPFEKVKNGTARRIIKKNQVFSRIHVEDIARILCASIAHPHPGAVYNLCDDEAAPPQDVLAYAAELLSVDLPPEVPFEQADLSPMARSFYAESKRVDNSRLKRDLGVDLLYPTYRTGLRAVLRAESEGS